MPDDSCAYVTRGGLKLAAALSAFHINVQGCVCADLGSHAGGFVDCLLRNGAARVYAVDTAYGVLDYRLRTDQRVTVCERTNALHYVCPEQCDLVTIDVGWTPQRLVLPAARRYLRAESGRVVSLVKPQYEAPRQWLRRGVVPAERVDEVLETFRADVRDLGWRLCGQIESPLRGHGGNVERLCLLAPV